MKGIGARLWGVCTGLFVMALMLLGTTGCDNGTKVDIANTEATLRAVIARHDAYVSADTKITDADKATALRSSAILTRIIDTAMKKKDTKAEAMPSNTGNYAETLQRVGKTNVYALKDGKECYPDGTCKVTHVISTEELAVQGLYFQSEKELKAYQSGKIPAPNVLKPEKTSMSDEIEGQKALERLESKYASKLAGKL